MGKLFRLGDLTLCKDLAACSRLSMPFLSHSSETKLGTPAFLQIEVLPGMLITILLLFGFWLKFPKAHGFQSTDLG